MKFCWTTIMVNNLEESLKFYQHIVGLKLNTRFEAGPGVEIAFLGDGETQVELVDNKNNNQVNLGPDISLGFEVESLDQLMAFLKTENIEIHSGPFQPNPQVKFLFVTDPNGLKIQFVERM
ncbi:MAG: VOC family protein [Peptococcaceae bacterium]|jgi:lactoylglutathione lyase|nr:VOC family protein [Peptococcaceae bacterium]